MKKRLGRKLLSLIIAGMLFMNLPINVQAADEITVDFNRFNETNISWCNSAGEYGSGTKPDNCVFYVTSGGGTIKNGYSVALINVTSNRYIGQDEAYPLDNYGTIVSTDGCIDYVNNGTTGTIKGGTFQNVIMTGGTIKNAIVKGVILCDDPGSEYVIENVTLEDGAKIVCYESSEYVIENVTLGEGAEISVDGEPVAAGPGTYTVTVEGGVVTVEEETAPEEEPAPGTDNGSNSDSENNDSENNDSANNDSSNNDSDTKPEKDTNEDKKQEEPQEPKESEEHIFTRELLTRAATAKAGDIVAIDATVWHSFNANVLKELLSKEEVSYTFYYNYGGECFYITIPAGAVLEEGCEWYGPLKLNAMFGRTMIEKKDLHAAINK